jgi:hypothetical protein
MSARRKGLGRLLVVAAVGIGLACEPIVGAPPPAAPINACPAHPCDAYKQLGAAPTCDAGVCAVTAPTTDLLLVIGLATDSYLAPGRTYLARLNGASPVSASCMPPACCDLPSCSPPICPLPQWIVEKSSYFIAPHAASAAWADWNLGNKDTTALPVEATFRRLIGPAGTRATDALDAFDLGLPVEPVLADNAASTGDVTPLGPNGTPQIQFQTYLQPGCYERTLVPFSPFSRAFPPEIKPWPPDDSPAGISDFDVTRATDQGPVAPRFDILRAEGLGGWTAYLRDTQTKRVFSNVVPLTGSLAQGVTLLTNHGTADAFTGLELVLAPPSGQPLPTEVFAPTGNELSASLAYPSLPTPVTMTGRIRTPAGAPVPADVYFTATDISKGTGGKFPPNFEFTTRVSTTLDAKTGASTYSVLLPQGDYAITVRPTDGANAVTTTTRPVGGQGNDMTGEDFDVSPLVSLSGSAVVADGRALAEAIAEALPTQCATSLPDAAPPPGASEACLPRPAQTLTDADGAFVLTVDPGEYLLRIRPRDGSRLPWKMSSIVVGNTSMVVPPLVIPAPVSVGMQLTDSAGEPATPSRNNPVIDAIVRVYTDPSQGAPAVELGEAITDGDGNYQMYIAPPGQ